jgi:apolipoprotein N-acyltransferase
VDLFLQPSWTWNAISSRHFETNAVRAVENGFTLFRCSSNGESGIVDPRGKVQQRQFTGHSPLEKHVFSLPLNRRVQTLYASAGYGFEWLCLAVTACFYLAVLIPAWAFQFAFSYFSPLDN